MDGYREYSKVRGEFQATATKFKDEDTPEIEIRIAEQFRKCDILVSSL